MIENMSNEELCMLELLSYMNADGGLKGALKDGFDYKSLQDCENVGEYLNQFDTEKLRTEKPGDSTNGDSISREEYAAIIEKMRADENITSLKMGGSTLPSETEDYPLAYDLVDESGEHIVIFKGSSGGEEWKDDVEGVNRSDTNDQIEAAEYVSEINGSVTVVGHSKGGNKAMYCAIVCDNVKRCISMDGQGFSDEFIQKYQGRIANKASIVTNISYCYDYVHALMLPIPGSTQLYTGFDHEHNGVNSFAECHSPNSLFGFFRDSNGNLQVQADFNGCYTDEAKSIQIIRGVVEYIMHSDCEDKEGLIEYLAYVVGQFGGNKDEFLDKIKSGEEEIDSDKLATIIAYLIKYCDENNISTEDICQLLADIKVIEPDGKWNTFIAAIVEYFTNNDTSGAAEGAILDRILSIWMYLDLSKYSSIMVLFKGSDDVKKDIALERKLKEALRKIKDKYGTINYDPSKKDVTYKSKLKAIGILSDFHESTSPMLYYNLNGIQSALSKMDGIKSISMEETLIDLSVVSGESAEKANNLNNMYNSVFEKMSDLITKTQSQIQEIYDTVYTLENS